MFNGERRKVFPVDLSSDIPRGPPGVRVEVFRASGREGWWL